MPMWGPKNTVSVPQLMFLLALYQPIYQLMLLLAGLFHFMSVTKLFNIFPLNFHCQQPEPNRSAHQMAVNIPRVPPQNASTRCYGDEPFKAWGLGCILAIHLENTGRKQLTDGTKQRNCRVKSSDKGTYLAAVPIFFGQISHLKPMCSLKSS